MYKHRHHGGATTDASHDSAPVPGKQTLTQSLGMASPGAPAADPAQHMYDDAARRLAAAGHHLEQDVSRWNIGLDVLSAGMVRSAGEQAMTDFLLVLQGAGGLRGSPMEEAGQRALESARELVAQLGLFHFAGQPVAARAVTIEDGAALSHISAAIARAERCIADAIRLFDLCQGGKVAGVALDPAARLEAAQLVADHATSDEETRWLETFMRATNIRHTMITMGKDTYADRLERKAMIVQEDERYFATKQNGHDFDAAEMSALDDDAAKIEEFIANDAYGWRYVEVLEKYPPAQRLYLVQLLNHRHELENMVHRGGGDKAIALIRECPGLGQWEYDYGKVTAKSTWDKVDDSVGEMVSELPGATLEFVGGVYHEMGHLPAIGPVFERAGKSFDDLAKVTDDAIGVNEDDVKTRNAIAGGTGHVVAAIGISAVGGEAAEAKRAYDAGSAVDRAAGVVMELRDGFHKAQESWETVTGVVSEVVAGFTEYETDALAGDQDKWKHVIGHLDAVLDLAIDKLGAMEGAALGGREGKVKKAAADRDAEQREEEIDKAGDAAMSQELRDEHAAVEEAAGKYARAGTAKRPRYKAELEAHARKVRELGERDALKIATARQQAERAQDEKASRAAEAQADLEKAGDKVGYYKDRLGDVLKEAIVGFTVGALKGAKEELRKAAERLADGKSAGLDVRQIMIAALSKGASGATVGLVMPRVKKMLTKFFVNAVGDVLAQIDDELRGASSLAEGAIEEAVDWGLEQLGVQERIEGEIEELVARAFGGNEALAGGESSEGSPRND